MRILFFDPHRTGATPHALDTCLKSVSGAFTLVQGSGGQRLETWAELMQASRANNHDFDAIAFHVPENDEYMQKALKCMHAYVRMTGARAIVAINPANGPDPFGLLSAGAAYIYPKGSDKRVLAEYFARAAGAPALPSKIFTLGPVSINLSYATVMLDGKRVQEISAAEFDILKLLLARDGEAVSEKEMLAARKRLSPHVVSHTIPVHISRLRACLRREGERDFGHRLIRTVHGKGYRLVTTLEELNEPAYKGPALKARGNTPTEAGLTAK